MIYLLDTDHVSFLQSASAEGQRLRLRLRNVRSDDYGTTVVTYEEQCRGWLNQINRAQTPTNRVAAYSDLRDNLDFFSRIAVWEYDGRADTIFVALRAARIQVGTKDLRIAAIALANSATVLTRNTRDFDRVPDLPIEDWSV